MPFRLWRGVELCKCDMDFLFADSFRGKKKHNPHYIIYWWVWGREGRIYASCITRTLVLSIFNDVLLWKRVSQRPARQTGSCVDRCASATTLVSHLHYTTHRARNAAAQFLPNSVAISLSTRLASSSRDAAAPTAATTKVAVPSLALSCSIL